MRVFCQAIGGAISLKHCVGGLGGGGYGLELPQQVTMLQLDVGKDGKGPTYYVDTEIMTALFLGNQLMFLETNILDIAYIINKYRSLKRQQKQLFH